MCLMLILPTQELECAQQQHALQVQQLQEAAAGLVDAHSRALEEVQQQLTEMESKHKASLERMRGEHAGALAALAAAHESEVVGLQVQHEQELGAVKAQAAEQVSALGARHAAELVRLGEAHSAAVEAVQAVQREEVAAVQARHEGDVTRLMAERDAAQVRYCGRFILFYMQGAQLHAAGWGAAPCGSGVHVVVGCWPASQLHGNSTLVRDSMRSLR